MAKEIFVTIDNQPGELLRMSKALGKKVNIEAISVEGLGDVSIVRMLVSDGGAAERRLKAEGYQVRSHDTMSIALPNRPGELIRLCEALASEGINLESMFGSAGKNAEGYIVLRADDMERARKVLKGLKAAEET